MDDISTQYLNDYSFEITCPHYGIDRVLSPIIIHHGPSLRDVIAGGREKDNDSCNNGTGCDYRPRYPESSGYADIARNMYISKQAATMMACHVAGGYLLSPLPKAG
jgi:hypothetical protein